LSETNQTCVESGCWERPYRSGKHYAAFCDPSGGSVDSFTLAIGHLEKDVAVRDCIREILAPFSPDAATAEILRTLKAYGVTRVGGDQYAGEWVTD
jgi:hypothetical protein